VSAIWGIVAAIGIATMAIKAAGPVLLGERPLPVRVKSVVALLAPALFAALVGTATLGAGQSLVVDARIVGVGAAVVALALRAPTLAVVVVAALAAALARLAGIS
jgi:branched-subunit amino acid transport protein